MGYNLKAINEAETIFELTGNPFVDAGIATISAIVEKSYSNLAKTDLGGALEFANEIYSVKEWRGNIQDIMLFNTIIYNPFIINNNPEKSKLKIESNTILNWWIKR